MLNNNQGHFGASLSAARHALVRYRAAGDQRGIVRALSQVAQQLENTGQSGEALVTAGEAIEAARLLDDPALLAAVLGRCANALVSDHIETARSHYCEASQLLEGLGRDAECSRILYWWADAEYREGNFPRAAALIEAALPKAQPDVKISAILTATAIYWALDDRARAEPSTRTALDLARGAGDSIYTTWALSWGAMLGLESDPDDATRLFGYAERQRKNFEWTSDAFERSTWGNAQSALRDKLGADRYDTLLAEGAAWNQDTAFSVASGF